TRPETGDAPPTQRGPGTFTVNTGGNREDATNFLVNGVNMNDLLTNILILQPTLSVLQEFRIDTSTPSAEFGRTSGAVVNIVTRSGSNHVHGSGFEFFRDDALDARNYFRPPSLETPPLRRHQFGVGVGGPIVRDRTFFFAAYEGVRQAQGLDVNTVVLSDAQRAAIVDPTVRHLATLVPQPNTFDSSGTARYVGFAAAPVSVDQAAIDVMQSVGRDGRLHGFFAIQADESTEPFLLFNTIPGFGFRRSPHRQVLSLSFARSGGERLVNEARFGFNRFSVAVTAPARFARASFGIAAGPDSPAPLPQFNVAGAFNFGGPTTVPQARDDTSWTLSDTASYLRGNHALKFGGEFRGYVTDSYQRDPGTFNFPDIAAFVSGTANSFTWFSGDRASYITQRALGLFAQDAYRWRSDVTAEIGLRYEWNISPAERDNRFVVFDAPTASLVRVGVDTDGPVYRQNAQNVEPRVGLAWTRDAGR